MVCHSEQRRVTGQGFSALVMPDGSWVVVTNEGDRFEVSPEAARAYLALVEKNGSGGSAEDCLRRAKMSQLAPAAQPGGADGHRLSLRLALAGTALLVLALVGAFCLGAAEQGSVSWRLAAGAAQAAAVALAAWIWRATKGW